ncbi:MAG: hypothetical protein HQL16_02270 [Candidatus Omnitrophica bacterium]|nr:hypothetical protein [Candidatus Omnitrophota bacterium]
MKKIVLALFLLSAVMPAVSYAAFTTDDTAILEPKEITALTDEKLTDIYIDVLAEMEASRAFHSTSGFTPKEYEKYKNLVKYRLQLLIELHRRKLELPPSIN